VSNQNAEKREPDQACDPNEPFAPVSRRSATLVNLFFQYAGAVLTIVRGLVLAPLFIKYLGLEVYGAWLASGEVLSWIAVAEGGTIHVQRQQIAMLMARNDRTGLSESVGSGIVVSIVLGSLAAAIGLAFAPLVPWLLSMSGQAGSDLMGSFMLAVIATGVMLISGAARGTLQGFQLHTGQGITLVVAECVSLAATIILLLKGFGVWSLGIALLLREIVSNFGLWGCAIAALRQRRLRPRVSRSRAIGLLSMSSWPLLNYVADMVLQRCDGILVALFVGKDVVPVVVLTRRAWDIAAVFLSRLSFAFQPGLAHVIGEGNMPVARHTAARLLTAVSAGCALALCGILALNRPFMDLWLETSNYAGDAFNVLAGAGVCIAALYFLVSQVASAFGDMRASALVQFIPNAWRVVGLIAMLAVAAALDASVYWAMLAVPVSVLIGQVASVGYVFATWKRLFEFSSSELRIQFLQVGGLMLIGSLIGSAGYLLLPAAGSWTSLAISGLVVGLFGFSGLLLGSQDLRRQFAGAAVRRLALLRSSNRGTGDQP